MATSADRLSPGQHLPPHMQRWVTSLPPDDYERLFEGPSTLREELEEWVLLADQLECRPSVRQTYVAILQIAHKANTTTDVALSCRRLARMTNLSDTTVQKALIWLDKAQLISPNDRVNDGPDNHCTRSRRARKARRWNLRDPSRRLPVTPKTEPFLVGTTGNIPDTADVVPASTHPVWAYGALGLGMRGSLLSFDVVEPRTRGDAYRLLGARPGKPPSRSAFYEHVRRADQLKILVQTDAGFLLDLTFDWERCAEESGVVERLARQGERYERERLQHRQKMCLERFWTHGLNQSCSTLPFAAVDATTAVHVLTGEHMSLDEAMDEMVRLAVCDGAPHPPGALVGDPTSGRAQVTQPRSLSEVTH